MNAVTSHVKITQHVWIRNQDILVNAFQDSLVSTARQVVLYGSNFYLR